MVKALKNLINGAEDEAALLHVEWQRAKTDYPDLTLHHLEALVRVTSLLHNGSS